MISRTNQKNEAFKSLVKFLDKELAVTDGDDHDFYHQFNGIENLNQVVIFTVNEKVVACGAIKRMDSSTAEIKRMYTAPEHRGRGIAYKIINELESWARELEYSRLILETGSRQTSALKLYEKVGYRRMSNYGPYVDMENSICFQKMI